MPSHSRSRDRYRDRKHEEHRRHHKYSLHQNHDNDDNDDGGDISYERDEYHRFRSRHLQGHRRDYDSHAHEENEDYKEDDLMVNFPRQELPSQLALSRPSPQRMGGGDGKRMEKSKAKESPATSPIKKKDRNRDREGHRRGGFVDGNGSPAKGTRLREGRHHGKDGEEDKDSDRERRRERRRRRERGATAEKHTSADSSNSTSLLLNADALARLNAEHEKEKRREWERAAAEEEQRQYEGRRRQCKQEPSSEYARDYNDLGAELQVDKRRKRRERAFDEKNDNVGGEEAWRHRSRARVVSGAIVEEGRSPEFRRRGGGGGGGGGSNFSFRWRRRHRNDPDASASANDDAKKKPKWVFIGIAMVILLIIIIVPAAVVASKKQHQSAGSNDSTEQQTNLNASLNGVDPSSIPAAAKGTYLDPFTWYDTRDFNLTYTNETVGGLSVMGLDSTWDDSAQPNANVPPLNQNFSYGSQPIRGVNLGGWLSLEPFITPSLFSKYPITDGIIDEYTLSQQLGSSAPSTLEQHYATFISEADFATMRDAGLDHVRIQYSYWAVKVYDGDPYVPQISWRYLLRAIEYCRNYGLRVKLDLHGIPGSQNGWNHSGRQGDIGWLNGTDGDLNAQRALEIHDQLSQFFAQPRYKNVVTIYGLVNEPKMLSLPIDAVLNWTVQVTQLVQKNGITAHIALHDGFLNLDKWKYMLKDGPPNMLLDTHQYTIFNLGEICLSHVAKVQLICQNWVPMLSQVNSQANGWGPTICGEFSQADTDCAQYLNDVGQGARWTGTFETGNSSTDVLTPQCATTGNSKYPTCSCTLADADPSTYSNEYKTFLQTYAEAQFSAFESAWGWFYWTWETESAPQWSYKQALANGFMPHKAYQPSFKCGSTIPDFGNLPEYY